MSATQQRSFTQTHAAILLLGTGLIYTLSALGAFEFVDGQAQDIMTRILLRWKEPYEGVLIVHSKPAALEDPHQLARLLRSVEPFRPRVVAFTRFARASTAELNEAIAALPLVVLPEAEDAAGPLPDSTEFPLAPEAPRGALALPPLEGGVARKHRLHPSESAESVPSLELAAATGVRPTLASAALPHEVYVSFRGEANSVPAVSLESLIAGNIHSDLMADKCLLVGPALGRDDPGLVTPTTTRTPGMTLLEYRGNVLNTLLTDAWSVRAPPWAILAATAATCAAAVSIQLFLRLRIATLLAALGGCALLSICALCMEKGRVWIPPTAPALAMAFATGVVIHMRATLVEARFREVAGESEATVKENPITCAQALTNDSLQRLLKAFQEVTGSNRTLLLGVSGKRELTELAAVGCSIHDLAPSERTPEHARFRLAADSSAPVLVDGILPRSEEEEHHFLAAIALQGHPIAFLAFTLGAELSSSSLQDVVLDATSRLGQLLSSTTVTASNAELARELLGRTIQSARNKGIDPLQQNLSDLAAAAELASGTLGAVSASVAVFDVFGSPIFLNPGMQTLLRQEGVPASALNLRDLLTTLTDLDSQRVQAIVQSLVLQEQPFATALTSPARPQEKKAMIVRPLPRVKARGTMPSSVVPTRCFLCQVFDTEEIASLYTLKTDLLEKLSSTLRSNLSDINMCAFILDRDAARGERRAGLAPRIQRLVHSSIRNITDCTRYFAAAESPTDAEAFPLNPIPVLMAAAHALREPAERQQVKIQVDHPRFPGHVLGNPQVLEQVFHDIIHLLLADASELSTIDIRLQEHRDTVTVSFQNKGFGIPDDLLQTYLRTDHDLRSDHLTALRDSLPTLSAWNATLEAHSSLGTGYTFELHLVRFL